MRFGSCVESTLPVSVLYYSLSSALSGIVYKVIGTPAIKGSNFPSVKGSSILNYKMGVGCSTRHPGSAPPVGQGPAGSHGNVHVISSKQEWESKMLEATTSGKIVVVDFTAAWCGPCQMIAPFFSELSEKYQQLVFLKVDVDDMHELSTTWDVRAMPTFIFIKDGKEIDKLVGANKPELEKKVIKFATESQ